jgi:hypothetical protein
MKESTKINGRLAIVGGLSFLLGEVKLAGSSVSGTTVFTAVALPGGYTYRAKTAEAYVTRALTRKKEAGRGSQYTGLPWRCHRCSRAALVILASNERPWLPLVH